MIGVIVSFTLSSGFNATALRAIAQNARAKFEAMPGLRAKIFTLDEARQQATNFYVWDDEEAARTLFTPEFGERVAALYGATPAISFVEIAALAETAR